MEFSKSRIIVFTVYLNIGSYWRMMSFLVFVWLEFKILTIIYLFRYILKIFWTIPLWMIYFNWFFTSRYKMKYIPFVIIVLNLLFIKNIFLNFILFIILKLFLYTGKIISIPIESGVIL